VLAGGTDLGVVAVIVGLLVGGSGTVDTGGFEFEDCELCVGEVEAKVGEACDVDTEACEVFDDEGGGGAVWLWAVDELLSSSLSLSSSSFALVSPGFTSSSSLFAFLQRG